MSATDKDTAGIEGVVLGRWLLSLAAGLAGGALAWGLLPYPWGISVGLGLLLAALVYMLLRRLGLPYAARVAQPAPVAEVAPLVPVTSSARAAEELLAKARMAAPIVEEVDDKAAPGMQRPETLKAARGGLADDLKIIKGIGPKLELMCHRMGYFHFDQIANWTEAEVAWVDANLEGFKGRVSRDRWVAQAKVIVEIGPAAFLKQLESGREF